MTDITIITPSGILPGGGEDAWLSGGAGPYARAYAGLKLLPAKFSYDEFKEECFVSCGSLWDGRLSLNDFVVAELRHLVLLTHEFDPGREHVFSAAAKLCQERRFDTVKSHLTRCHMERDQDCALIGKPFLARLGAAVTRYNKAVVRSFLIAGAKRVFEPACQYDQFPILVAPQGVQKSGMLRALVQNEEWFGDADLFSMNPAQRQETLRGKWIFEVPELGSFDKKSASHTKAVLSMRFDLARRPYDRVVTEQPRRCVIFGTTNEAVFLDDPTGNRRALTLEVGLPAIRDRIDLDWIVENRNQLWGEAVELMKQGENPMLPSKYWALSAKMQANYAEHDPWQDRLASLTGIACGDTERLTNAAVFSALKISTDRQSPALWRRAAQCLAAHGWRRRTFKAEGKTVRGFVRELTGESWPVV